MQLHKTLKYNPDTTREISGKQLLFAFLFTWSFCFMLNDTCAQQTPKLWHGIEREIRYKPDGEDFVIQNGKRRFNRALYGTNTAFRVEAGDLPEFALYLPGMGGNLKFGLISGSESRWLINASSIEARYRPGTMIYKIKDAMLGNGMLTIQVLAGSADENIIVKANFSNTSKPVKLLWAFGGATGKKFSRDGDIGADPESSFYLQPDYCKGNVFSIDKQNFTLNFSGKAISEAGRYEIDQTGTGANKTETVTKSLLYGIYPSSEQVHIADANAQSSPLALINSKGTDKTVITGLLAPVAGKDQFWVIQNGRNLNTANATQLFNSAEVSRRQLAARVQVKTPDPYINTLGGTLSVAEDGIWESPSYMHGAIAWRMRLNAWRGPYVADPIGRHNRAWSHFTSYALSQMTDPESGPVVADTALHLARQQEKLGNSMFSSGYISRNPGGKIVAHHYDMNLVYIDALLNHFKWTGDIAQVKQLWPVITRHLAWEKRNYDADGDGLYDAYCAIWASDALQYSGGGVTHSSAYNYRANKSAAELAKLIGEDPKLYQQEAAHILNAINKQLWMPQSGQYAEYKDLLGNQLLHPSAGLWTVYHAIDSEVPDAFQTYQALRYVDTQIPHIPVIAKGLTGDNFLLATTNWLPYDWSLNNVVMAENLHMALAYWQGNRKEDAYQLWKSAIIESMYLGASPGNFQQISFYDAQRGELYRDFADPIGMASRSLVEGLFGIQPDALNGKLLIKPGFPEDWNYASLNIPDVKFDFKRTLHSGSLPKYSNVTYSYHIIPSFSKPLKLIFQLNPADTHPSYVTVNGVKVNWKNADNAVGTPIMEINAGVHKHYDIKVVFKYSETAASFDNPGQTISVPISKVSEPAQFSLEYSNVQGSYDPQNIKKILKGDTTLSYGYHTSFLKLKQGKFVWWAPLNIEIQPEVAITAENQQQKDRLKFKVNCHECKVTVNPGVNQYTTIVDTKRDTIISVPSTNLILGTNAVEIVADGKLYHQNIINWNITPKQKLKTEAIDLKTYFNDKVTNIFKHQYLSPRPKSPTLQLPTQGIGNWAYPLITANIDDSGLKKAAVDGIFTIPQGIPFATSTGDEKNILFTSMWDNFPHQYTVPLSGNASHAYFLMAGSTNPMQTRMVNGTISILYTDGTKAVLELKNPENWWPIEQDDNNDGFAFDIGAPQPLRVHLKTGEVTDHNTKFTSIKGFSNRAIDGGAATVLDLPLDKTKQLKSLQLTTITNDVVIGLMAITLIRE